MRVAQVYGARALGTGALQLAIPRGALYGRTLDLLDRIGVATQGLRGDSRALVFDCGELTVITMRPSDVPTYVEVHEEIAACTARLVANRVAHKLRVTEVDELVERLREAAR